MGIFKPESTGLLNRSLQDGSFLKRESDEGTTTGTWEIVGGDEIILSSKPIGGWDGKYHLRVMEGERIKLVSRLGYEWKKMQ